jgi:hypothetical protein
MTDTITTAFSIWQGDGRPSIELALSYADGSGVVPFAELPSFTKAELVYSFPNGKIKAIVSVEQSGSTNYLVGNLTPDDTDTAGEFEGVLVFDRGLESQQTFGPITITVKDNVVSVAQPAVVVPPATLVTFGIGMYQWTPKVLAGGTGDPSVGALVRVTTAAGKTLGPATTGSTGQALASDGLGAFRLDAGLYTCTVTSADLVPVTTSFKFQITATGDEVIL